MHQRYWGALLLAVALLSAAVTPKVRSSEVSGEPVAMVLPGSPAVGDCVVSVPNRLPDLSAVRRLSDLVDYPTVTLGECGGAIIGEVGYVLSGASPPAVLTLYDYQRDAEACAEGTQAYTGSVPPVVDNPAATTAMAWALGLLFERIPFGPTAVQRRAGQHWAGCVVTTVAGESYRGRLRDALSTGTVPESLGSCWSSVQLTSAERVSCAVPHPLEVLGTSSVGVPPVTIDDIRRSCAVFAGRVLRTANPTADAALRITTIMPSAPRSSPDEARTVDCVATSAPGGVLNGTVIGLGGRPKPRPSR